MHRKYQIALATAVLAVVAVIAVRGGRVSSQDNDQPPALQLGDSVTEPSRAVSHGVQSTLAFKIAEKDLLPESVAYDSKSGSFYVGSTRKGKIVRVDAKGNARDFVTPRQDGLWSVIGLKAHAERRVLWACSFYGDELEKREKVDGHPTGVFAFDLDTGKLIRKWVLDTPGETHGFNDLVLTRGNDAYITHTIDEPAIYRITDKDKKLELFLKTEGLTGINGITLTPDERTLFVAGNEGVGIIDIASRKMRMLTAPEGEPMGAIDGLYYYRESLLAIRGNSVNRYRLDETLTRVVLTEVIEANHPLMAVPTTGVIVGDEFYYVANAQFDFVNRDGSLMTDKLSEPAILKLKLH